MGIITIDFETYFNKKYSLKTMTIEEYINDPLFEVIVVGVKINHSPTKVMTDEEFIQFCLTTDWSKEAVLCHNTVFDGSILAWKYKVKPKVWLDTLSMAAPRHQSGVGLSLAKLAEHYQLGDKLDGLRSGKRYNDMTYAELDELKEYCQRDVDITYALYKLLRTTTSTRELEIIHTVLSMHIHPRLVLDPEVLQQDLKDYEKERSEILKACGLPGDIQQASVVLRSNDKMAEAIRALGYKPPMKVSPRTGKQTYAFARNDIEFTNMLKSEDARLSALVEARLMLKSSIRETRIKSLLKIHARGNGLPIHLKYYGAKTGRLSGAGGINMQNLPRGSALRQAIKAPDGYVLVGADQAQIEARLNMWFCGQHDVLEAFAQGRDVYSEFASAIYNRTITKADVTERFIGKTCVLGLGYQMGATRFQHTLESGSAGQVVYIPPYEAERIVTVYRRHHPSVVAMWKKLEHVIDAMIAGHVTHVGPVSTEHETLILPNGRIIAYPFLNYDEGEVLYCSESRLYHKMKAERIHRIYNGIAPVGVSKLYGGKLLENIIQGLAAIIVSNQMAIINRYFPVTLQVHDENIACVPIEQADKAAKFMEHVMSEPPEWATGLPLKVEVKIGKTYKEIK